MVFFYRGITVRLCIRILIFSAHCSKTLIMGGKLFPSMVSFFRVEIKFTREPSRRLSGLVVWFSLWVREVPVSITGWAPFSYIAGRIVLKRKNQLTGWTNSCISESLIGYQFVLQNVCCNFFFFFFFWIILVLLFFFSLSIIFKEVTVPLLYSHIVFLSFNHLIHFRFVFCFIKPELSKNCV